MISKNNTKIKIGSNKGNNNKDIAMSHNKMNNKDKEYKHKLYNP